MSKADKLWRSRPTREDLKAARNYLTLVYPPATAKRLTTQLARAATSQAAAKDLLRASDLPLLPRDESHVQADLKRIGKGKTLSPVLLVRGNQSKGIPLLVADGYHRICALNYFDEDAPIAFRIAPL